MEFWNLYQLRKIQRSLNRKNFRGKYLIKRLLSKIEPKTNNNLIVRTKYNLKLKIDPIHDKGIEKKIFDYGIYEEGTLWCFDKIIKRGDIIFDVGANIGLTSLFAAKRTGKAGKVYAFEPLPSTFKILKQNLQLNKIKNVEPIDLALTKEAKRGFIYENLHINRGAASLYSKGNQDGIEIKEDTLDSFTAKFEIKNINFIKIDIEGSELPMLMGGIKFFENNQKPIICIEFSRDVNSPYHPDELYYFLKRTLGYSVFKQIEGKESITPLVPIETKAALPSHDNLYCFQPYHFDFLPSHLFYGEK